MMRCVALGYTVGHQWLLPGLDSEPFSLWSNLGPCRYIWRVPFRMEIRGVKSWENEIPRVIGGQEPEGCQSRKVVKQKTLCWGGVWCVVIL